MQPAERQSGGDGLQLHDGGAAPHFREFCRPLPHAERKADWVHCTKCCAEFYLQGAAATDTSATSAAAPGAATAPAAAAGTAPTGAPGAAAAPSAAAGTAPTGPAVAVALRDLTSMWTDGALTAEEFSAAKRQILRLS